MRKLARWITLHQKLTFILLSSIYVLGTFGFFDMLSAPSWVAWIVAIVLCIFSYLFVSAAPDALIKDPLKALHEHCDPYPLLRDLHGIPMEKLPDLHRQTMTINYCFALHYIGNYQLAFDTLSSLNIDKHGGMIPVNKAIYYNNLSAACRCLQMHEEAEIWYTKMMQIYSDLPDNKLKKNLESVVLSTQADHHYYTGEYEKAMDLLNAMKPQNRIVEIDLHMQFARNYIALGEKDLARENLQFVIENGNKLYAVTEAKELLAQLDAE